MHPEADALLDAIFDDPFEDMPRLVYADWLQEHDQEAYAQFIRLQCAAAREPFWSAEANRLWEEIGRVWTRLDEEWWPATRDWEWNQSWRGSQNLDAIHFHRGFLRESLSLTTSQLLRNANSCWPWLPLPATALELDGSESELLASPRARRIRALRIAFWSDREYALIFSRASELTNLEVLDLSAGMVVQGQVDGMLQTGLYPKLREIHLRVYDSGSYLYYPELSPEMRQLKERAEARFEKVVLTIN